MILVILSSDEALAAKPQGAEEPKTKVSRADIVVEGTPEKPYFCIHYQELGSDEVTVGFGSYCLDYVFEWRDQYLYIVDKGE